MGVLILFGGFCGSAFGLLVLLLVLDFYETTGRRLPWEDKK